MVVVTSVVPGMTQEMYDGMSVQMIPVIKGMPGFIAHAGMAIAGGWDPLEWRIKMTEGLPDWQLVLRTLKEKAGFRFADRLHRSVHDVDDQFYAELKRLFNNAELIELTATAAAFEMFTRIVDSLNLPTTPAPASVPRK